MKKVVAKFRLATSIFLALLLAGCSQKMKKQSEMVERVYVQLEPGKSMESASDSDRDALNQFVNDYLDSAIAGAQKDYVILVTVYTSPTGSKAANARVADNRTRAIKEFLRSSGVDMSSVVVKHVSGSPRVGIEVERVPTVEVGIHTQVHHLKARAKKSGEKAAKAITKTQEAPKKAEPATETTTTITSSTSEA